MSYFQPYLDGTGVHLPDYSDRIEALVNDYHRIFDTSTDSVYLGEDTQDYQLLSLFARALDDLSGVIADVYNSMNPNWATGAALDRLLPLTGLKRMSASYSTVALKLTGNPGTTLNDLTVRDNDLGYSWRVQGSVTFPDAQDATETSVTATAVCTEAGAVSVGIGTCVIMETPDVDWYSVTNEALPVPGRNVETDAEVRARRLASVALPGVSMASGIRAALVELEQVRMARIEENNDDQTDAETGIPGHSISAVVQLEKGYTLDEDVTNAVAGAIYLKKAPGIGTHGVQSGVYTDERLNQHTVYFEQAEDITVGIEMVLHPLTGYNASTGDAVRQAVVDYVDSLDIGESLIPSMLYNVAFGVLNGSAPTFSISAVNDGNGDPLQTVTATFKQKLTTDAENVVISTD